MAVKIGPASSPSDVLTSINATTPLKHPPPDVEHIIAAKDLSPASTWSSSELVDVSGDAAIGRIECLGRWTDDNREEVTNVGLLTGASIAGGGGMLTDGLDGAPRPSLPIDAFARSGSDEFSGRFIFSLLSASDRPAIDLDVSDDKPSLRDVDEANEGRGRGTGSETDRGDCRPLGPAGSSLSGPSVPSCCLYSVGPETIRSLGRARGPDPSEDGYEGLRRTGAEVAASSVERERPGADRGRPRPSVMADAADLERTGMEDFFC